MRHRRRIDPTDHTPLYHQLADILREAINEGKYRPGDPLPAERELAEQYQISVDTVRDALSVLRREGLILSRRGKRSQVMERREVVTVIPVGPGVDISTRMPTEDERRALALPEGVPILVISRPGQQDEVVAGGAETVIRTQEDTPR